jgi:YD repeat-containing protein/VCBS repeat-containing protein
VLTFDSLAADHYHLQVAAALQSTEGVGLAAAYTSAFTGIDDLTSVLNLQFTHARMLRSQQTVSYDVTVTNIGTRDLLLPLVLRLSPQQHFDGEPQGNLGRADDGSWLIDLTGSLPGGLLRHGQSTAGQTITVSDPGAERVGFDPSVTGTPAPNQPPFYLSAPNTAAAAGQPYSYQALAQDPGGRSLTFLLDQAPAGMAVDAATGLVTWTPTVSGPAQAAVVLLVYDTQGLHATQEFSIHITGVNTPPSIDLIPAQIQGSEGQPLLIPVLASDPDGDRLVFWADNLPPGAAFDPDQHSLEWTPAPGQAGTYPDVRFLVSDGLHEVSATTTLLIAATNRPPTLVRPADLTVREGDTVRLPLRAGDPDGDALTFSSDLLPGGATLNPTTGLFEWTPAFFQHGTFKVPFTVSDGTSAVTVTTTITVPNVNAPPQFEDLGSLHVQEGQQLQFRAFAFDPNNPGFIPQDRFANGTLSDLEGSPPTVTYTVSGLPLGATFDSDTILFRWTPDYGQAGDYQVTFTATNNGDGTGTPLSSTVTVPITVLVTNRPPQVTPIPDQTVDRGGVLEVPLAAADPDANDPLVLSASGLPAFATLLDNHDGTGVLRFAPGAGDRGNFVISVTATDNGEGGKAAPLSASRSFVLSVHVANEPPQLDFIGDKVAVVGQPLTFTLHASDCDQDPLSFTVQGLPGQVLSPASAYGSENVTWTPTAADIGTIPVTFQVSDNGNGNPALAASDQQTIHVVVRTSNQAPVLAPVGNQTVTEGQTLTVSLSATDPDGDSLLYFAPNLPLGATFDPRQGILRWTPQLGQAGAYPGIVLGVTDGNLSSSETITIQVNKADQVPVLAPLAPQSGREGTPLQFTLAAADPDGDPVQYQALSQLPAGARLDPTTGKFTWTPGFDQSGTYTLHFAASDPAGHTATTDVTVTIDNVNRPPVLHASSHAVALGQTLIYAVTATDPDAGDHLTFSADGLPDGASFDAQTGQVRWTPGPGQAGRYTVTFSVSDGQAVVSQTAVIQAALHPQGPQVTVELTPSFPVTPGQNVIVHVSAASLADITALGLTVNGQPLTLDAQGRATLKAGAPGRMLLAATATDADGLIGHAAAVLKIRDPNDQAAPILAFDPHLDGSQLTAGADIVVTVQDSNLDSWVLEQAPFGSEAFTTLASGAAPVAGAAVVRFDPAQVPNGAYRLRLTATDMAGRSSRTEIVVEADTAAKPTQYLRQETDLSAVLGGATVNLVREYDSLARGASGSFGFGWRLANRDTDIATNVPLTGHEASGVYNPFRVSTRVYLTLPDGRRAGFTFAPVRHELPGVVWFTPAYQADPGVDYRLDSADGQLTLAGSRLFDLKTGRPYNPASGAFQGPEYTLTAPDGTVYDLSTARGVQEQITPAGARLFFSDSGITSSTGDAITFVHDAAGRLTSITGPDGSRVIYDYDGAGNLAAVHWLGSGQTNPYGYAPDDIHLLTLAGASAGAPGTAISYSPTPQILPTAADLGSAVRFTGAVQAGTLSAGSTDRYTFSLRDSELRSTASGIVLLGVSVQAVPGSALQPVVPTIPGLTPLATHSDGGSSFALFALDRAGLKLLEIRGANAGAYTLQLTVAGDSNADGVVNGSDAQLLTAALGSSRGDTNFQPAADLNDDGTINASDVQILGSNFGFLANRPPVVTPGSASTHTDLAVNASLAGLTTDPDGDPVYFRVLDVQHGTVRVSADGGSVTFLPEPGFSGQAGFHYVADDGSNASADAAVTVDVSGAPLLNLAFGQSPVRLNAGAVQVLSLTGDFADEKDVALPASYLTFTSTDPSVARVSARGVVTGVANGSAILVAASHGIQAATAITVGVPTDATALYLYNHGLTSYPQAVALPAQNGQRQLKISAGKIDDTGHASGTLYYVGNPGVAQVSADGLVTALAPGATSVVVINGPAEIVIPIEVDVPVLGATTLDNRGGVVEGSDGSLLMVPAGALDQATTVSITPRSEADLPMAAPTGFQFAGAAELVLGGTRLPVQLAAPVPDSIPTGGNIYVMRATELPDASGNLVPMWLQLETGVVGPDRMFRTTSPPWPGVEEGGVVMYGYGPKDAVSVVKGKITVLNPLGVSNDAYSVTSASPVGGGSGIAALASLTADPTLAITFTSDLTVALIGPTGLPVTTTAKVQLGSDGLPHSFNAIINNPPTSNNDPSQPPVIDSAKLVLNSFTQQVELVLTGRRFTYDNPLQPAAPGNRIFDLTVTFKMGDKTFTATPSAMSTSGEVHVAIPNGVVIGLAKISVTRPGESQRLVNGVPQFVHVDSTSKTVTLQNLPVYGFAALPGSDQIAAIDQDGKKLVAKIPVGESGSYPRSIAVTPDQTRAYVALRYGGKIAVVDAQALQEVDALPDDVHNPDSTGFNRIDLPDGATPFQIIIDSDGKFAYVSDEREGAIYVINVDPTSSDYNQCVKTIRVSPAPAGLRGLALNEKGDRLYVAAPEVEAFGGAHPGSENGHILVVSLLLSNNVLIDLQLPSFEAGKEPYGVTVHSESKKINGEKFYTDYILFTDRLQDAKGVGLIVASSDAGNSGVTYVPLDLGAANDYFDVNNAQAVVVTSDLKYAFVTGYDKFIMGDPAHDPNDDPTHPGGGNIGVIRDPFNLFPLDLPGRKGLVAATRPTPYSFPDNLAITDDDKYLYAAYRGNDAVFVYSAKKIVKEVETSLNVKRAGVDSNRPELVDYILNYFPVDDMKDSTVSGSNTDIDVNADFRLDPNKKGSDTSFIVVDADHSPIGTGLGTRPQGLAIQTGSQSRQLLGPDSLAPIDEGSVLDLTNAFLFTDSDLEPGQTWRFSIDWGDGSPQTQDFVRTITASDGDIPAMGRFGATHRYLNNKPDDEAYTITVKLTDPDLKSKDPLTLSVVVKNVAPQYDIPLLSVASVGQLFHPQPGWGTFTDPGAEPADQMSFQIDYGDGEGSQDGDIDVTSADGAAPTTGTLIADQTYDREGIYYVDVAVSDEDDAETDGTVIFNVNGPTTTAGVVFGPALSGLTAPAKATDPFFVATDTKIHSVNPASMSLFNFAIPGGFAQGASLADLPAGITFGGTALTAPSLMVVNLALRQAFAVNPTTGSVLASIHFLPGTTLIGATYDKDNNHILLVDSSAKAIIVVDAGTGQEVKRFNPQALAYDSGAIAVNPSDNSILLVNTSHKKFDILDDTGNYQGSFDWTGLGFDNDVFTGAIFRHVESGDDSHDDLFLSTQAGAVKNLQVPEFKNLFALSAPGRQLLTGSEPPPALSLPLVQALAATARQEWLAAGIAPAQAAILDRVQFQITALSGIGIGLTTFDSGTPTITLDSTAGGYGWFVDPTPADRSEFGQTLSTSAFLAGPGSPAYGKMDLLTVIAHEFGHVLGYGHSDTFGHPNDLMNDQLSPGKRILPVVPEPAPLFSGVDSDADQPVPLGIINGNFAVIDPKDPGFGWTVRGSGSVANGEAVLTTDRQYFTGFSETFVMPDHIKVLRFTVDRAALAANSLAPPDAFEAALLDAATRESLVGTAAGLSDTDAFLNVQQDGEVFVGPQVKLSGGSFDSPVTVTLDVSGIQAGTSVTLYFDLLGFGPATSSVRISDVQLLSQENQPPVATDDSYSVNENGTLTVPAAQGVLANDSDAENDPLHAVLVSGPAHGTLSLQADGSFTYTPSADFFGTDAFTYKDNDGADGNTASVTLTVNFVNHAPSFLAGPAQAVNEDSGPQTVAGWATAISAGPPSESGQHLIFLVSADNGALFSAGPAIDAATGTLTYTPAAHTSGTAHVTVRLQDDGGTANGGQDTSAPQTFVITVYATSQLTFGGSVVGTYGGTASLSATLTAGGLGLPNETITFRLNGTPVGTASTDANGVATLPGVSLAGLSAGTYAAYVGVGFAGDPVYAVSSGTADLIVNRATPAVAVTDKGDTYNGSAFAVTAATVTGVPADGTLASFGDAALSYRYYPIAADGTLGALLGGAPVHTGSYAVVAHFTSNNLNYTDADSAPVPFTITPAPLTIKADDKHMVYGAALPALTASYSGLVNGDTPATFAASPNKPPLLSTAPASSPAGTYPITPSGAADADYTISYGSGTLTINQDATTTSAAYATIGIRVTFTATVTANLPGSGTPTGSVDFFDNTTNTDLGTAPLAGGTAQVTMSNWAPLGAQTITASYSGDPNFLSSSTHLLTVGTADSVEVLNPTAAGALTLSGNASITIAGTVVVDSNSPTALTASGNAHIAAGSIQVVGGVRANGNVSFSPQPITGATPFSDPLLDLRAPSATGMPMQGAVSLSGNGRLTINPGIYSSIAVSGNAALTLNPGVYVLAGGGFTVTGNASVSGAGVLLYNAGSNYPGPGGSCGGLTLSGKGTINLTPAAAGTYAGLLIFQARDNPRALSLSGNGLLLHGSLIYAPAALLAVSGNGQLQATLIVNTLQLSGNAGSTLTAGGSSADLSSSATAGQLLAGDLVVYVDNRAGTLSAEALARIQDAITIIDQVINPFGVNITEVEDSAAATTVLQVAAGSGVGGAADGVLGCEAPGSITIVSGWNWYTGADATAVGAGQYDFETIVMHELGHALGLGHSADPHSVMYAALETGVARRQLGVADLGIPDLDAGPCGLHAAGTVPLPLSGEEAVPAAAHANLLVGTLPAAQGSSAAAARSLADQALLDGTLGTRWAGRLEVNFRTDALGNGGDDVLIGGAGDSLLIGGVGRDLLIGGIDSEQTARELANDAGSAWDARGEQLAALDSALREWAHTDLPTWMEAEMAKCQVFL